MNRRVVRLLVLLLLPVMIVASPRVADAATSQSDVAPVSFRTDSNAGAYADAGCNALGYWTTATAGGTTVYTLTVKTDCTTDFNASDPHLFIYPTGDGCSALGYAEVAADGKTTFTKNGPASCTITEICWEYAVTPYSNPWTVGTDAGCKLWGVGAPDQGGAGTPGQCTQATMGPAKISAKQQVGTSTYKWQRHVQVPFTTQPLGPDRWDVYMVMRHNSTGALSYQWAQAHTLPGTSPFRSLWGDTSESGYPAVPPETKTVIGGGVVRWANVTNSAALSSTPQQNSYGLVGVTDPSKCFFYWGEKVAITADERDEPAGAITPADDGMGGVDEPAPTDEPAAAVGSPCTFDFTDPATWASAGICQLVALFEAALGLLGDILSALASLAAAIFGPIVDAIGAVVGAILDGLTNLFVPSDGFFDSQVTQLRNDFNDTQPGAYVDSFTGQTYNLSASGCGGLPVDWQIEGRSFSFNLLGACSGFMATTAAIVKLAASALLIIFGAIACLRGLGAGFGWSPSMGRGSDAA